jgi:hypothetical protein
MSGIFDALVLTANSTAVRLNKPGAWQLTVTIQPGTQLSWNGKGINTAELLENIKIEPVPTVSVTLGKSGQAFLIDFRSSHNGTN